MEPQLERLPTIFKNRLRTDRTLMPTRLAVPKVVPLNFPSRILSASGADKTITPSHPFKILDAIILGWEPVKELLEGARIWLFGSRFHA